MICLPIRLVIAASAGSLIGLCPPAGCQSSKPPVKKRTVSPAAKEPTVHGPGRFGTAYTLQNKFQLRLLGGRYTVAPYEANAWMYPKSDEKLLVLDFAIKNMNRDDQTLDYDELFTVFDSSGNRYECSDVALDSKGRNSVDSALHPRQALGDPNMHDGLHAACALPNRARVVKIVVNTGRLHAKPEEQEYTYYIAGATKKEAGAPGDPKNSISPLPADVQDPAAKSGAAALAVGVGAVGQSLPSYGFDLRLNSASTTTAPVLGQPPDDGKKYVVLNGAAKSLVDHNLNFFDITGREAPEWQLVSGDGKKYKPVGYRAGDADENAQHNFEKGDEYAFRVIFAVPKAATVKKIVIGAADGRKWAFDGSVVKQE